MAASQNQIKIGLMQIDLDEQNRSEQRWAAACDFMLKEGSDGGAFDEFEQRYLQIRESGVSEDLVKALRADMLDNYVLAAFAAKNLAIPTSLPLIAWGAANRSEFEGWRGEISIIRALLWAGYDPSVPDERGATGLHYMVNLKYGSGCNPRALGYLLRAGCDPNVARNNGDTALITLCGHTRWTSQHNECMQLLSDAGGDIFAVAKDGETPLSLLKRCDAASPNPDRQQIIGTLEALAEKVVLSEAAGKANTATKGDWL